jgi:glycosyltransferase involved in cell wall biosynthesis
MRTLVMTMLDLDQEPNQRTHHVLATLAECSSETVLVTKVRTLNRRPRALLRDALRCRVSERCQGNVRVLRLHPFLNYAQGTAAGLVQGELLRRPPWHRRAVAAALSAFGVVRDFFLVPAFLATVLFRTRAEFDICVADNPWTAAAALLLRVLGRVRYVVYDDMDHVAGGQMLRFRQSYVAALERLAIRRADLAISVGWLLGAYRRHTTGREVLVIPNGVDPQRFAAAHVRPPHPPTLVYVGHLAHYSGVDLAIEALPHLLRQVPGARLLVVGDGDGPYVKGLERLAQARGVRDAVEFRGRVPYDAVPGLLAESDLGLATFRDTPLGRFAFPLKVVEYMAAGLPVLCTKGSEGEEILRRYPAGRAVAFTAEDLAGAAIRLLTSPEEYRGYRETALRAAQQFTWAHAMQRERDAIVGLMAPRVALDCRLLAWPGIGRYCTELASALISVAPDLQFFWLCRPEDRDRLPAAANATTLTVSAPPFSVAAQIALPWLLRRHGIKLLHVPNPTTLPLLARRLVVTVHDLILLRFPEFLPSRLARIYYRLMTRAAVGRARRIIAVSEFTRRDVAAAWPSVEPRTRTVLNGVSSRFQPVRDVGVRREVAERLELPASFALYVGTRKRHKNLPRLLAAYGRLSAEQHAHCPLVMVAPADERYPEVDDAIRRAGIHANVHWRSAIADEDLPALYTLARFVVLMSLYEGFGFPVAEANACGTPALIAAAASLPEVAGEAGLQADPCNVASIHSALARLIDDDALRTELAGKALANAQRFSWKSAAQQIAGIYREALT